MPTSMYRVAARAANIAWGYDKTVDAEHFNRIVEHAATGAGLRASVDAVYAATVDLVRKQVAEELRSALIAGAQMPEWARAGNKLTAVQVAAWAAGVADPSSIPAARRDDR